MAHDATCCAPVQAFSGFLSAVFGLRVLQGDAPAAGTDLVLSSFRRGAQTAAEQPALHSPLGLLSGTHGGRESELPPECCSAACAVTGYTAGTSTSGITLRAPSSIFFLLFLTIYHLPTPFFKQTGHQTKNIGVEEKPASVSYSNHPLSCFD